MSTAPDSTATSTSTSSTSSTPPSTTTAPVTPSASAAAATGTPPLAVARERQAATRVAPAIDVYEVDGAMVLLADVPGLAINDLEVSIERQVLTFRGTVRTQLPHGRMLHQEYTDVAYERSVAFSERIDAERISATLSGGVLRIVVPKLPSAQPRRIAVTSAHAA